MSFFRLGFFHPRFRLPWILVLIGVINALFWTGVRWRFDNSYTATQITFDFEETRSLADAYGLSHPAFLSELRARGATSLAIPTHTLASLRDAGRLTITSREVAERVWRDVPWQDVSPSLRFVVSSSDGALIDRVWRQLERQGALAAPADGVPAMSARADSSAANAGPDESQARNRGEAARGGDATPRRVELDGPSGANGILIGASRQLLNDLSLGFDPAQLELARAADLSVTARLSNPIELSPQRLDFLLDEVELAGARVVVFSDDEVLGFQTLVAPVARAMRERGLLFTTIEFSRQRGAGDFARSTRGELVRLHSVSLDETARLRPEVVVERLVRAARDRNMRVLFMRLPRQNKGAPTAPDPTNGPDAVPLELKTSALEDNLEFLSAIASQLERQPLPAAWLRPGLSLEPARGFGNYPRAELEASLGATGAFVAHRAMLFLSAVGTVGLALLLLHLFFDWSRRASVMWLIVGLLLAGVLSLSQGMGAKLLALGTGAFVPVVAILWGGLPLVWDRLWRPRRQGILARAGWAMGVLSLTTALCFLGALLIVALLNEWRYLSKADEFLGERATQFLPLLLVPLAFGGELFPHRVAREGAMPGRALMRARVARVLALPFTLKTAFAAITTLALGYLWMARFGNESGLTVSNFELALRSTLEQVFVARPRTKEIMMGHPAFVVAIFFALRGHRPLALGALFLGVIGQTNVVNTMCHLHTPVFYGLWRTLMGLLLGGLFGAALFVGLDWLWPRLRARLAAAPDSASISDANGPSAPLAKTNGHAHTHARSTVGESERESVSEPNPLR